MAIADRKSHEKGNSVLKMKSLASTPDLDRRELSAIKNVPAVSGNAGGPLALDIALIDEDPRQPRTNDNPGFSSDSLNELAASIRLRGVKTPISVRDNPDVPGRFLINHGARRFRGSMRAGKSTIPGFIDNDYNEADQVVENLQRNELTAREIADFIGRELAKGIRKGEIARSISKSPAFVTQHVTLLDLPDPIAAVFNSGRVRDVTVINELVTAFKKHPDEVAGWLSDERQEITRSAVMLLREFLNDKLMHERFSTGADYDGGESSINGNESSNDKNESSLDSRYKEIGARFEDPTRLKKAIVKVEHDARFARLIVGRRPSKEGLAWLHYEDDDREAEVNLAEVRLVALLEG